MKFTLLIPHWKCGKMTAYTLSKILSHRCKHELEIIIVDNNAGDGSAAYLEPFKGAFHLIDYPAGKLQSHGVAFDYALELVQTDHFITLENDSFPVIDNWLDYYEKLIDKGVEHAGSWMQLSGGTYVHPAGALYKTSNWQDAKTLCEDTLYAYFPNISQKDDFKYHLMVHHSILNSFLDNPEDYIELVVDYRLKNFKQFALMRGREYQPATMPFHNGMGGLNESIKTYGRRTAFLDSEKLIENKSWMKMIHRVGYEPGQWFSYWHHAMDKETFLIPTDVQWLPGRAGQQQEFSLMESGIKHIWGVSSYYGSKPSEMQDVIDAKTKILDELYDSLPNEEKI